MSTATTMQPFVEAFLEERHRLGFASRSMGHALRSFAAYVDDLEITGPLRIEVMARWARCPKNASDDPLTWARRLKLLRPFARWFRQFLAAQENGPIYAPQSGPLICAVDSWVERSVEGSGWLGGRGDQNS